MFQSTSNYHARKYGVRAAMPGFIGKKLCPNLVIVPTNFDKYRAVSDEVWAMSQRNASGAAPLWLVTNRCSWSLLDPRDFCRLWPSFSTNEPGWSLSRFYRSPGTKAALARVLTYTSFSYQEHHYRQVLIIRQNRIVIFNDQESSEYFAICFL